MVLETLRYADEVNKAAGFFREIPDQKPEPDLLDLATTLIDKKTKAFDASDYHDRYVDALKELISAKQKGKTLDLDEDDAPAPSRGSNVVDLMAALKRSLERPGVAKAREEPAAKKAVARKPATKKTSAPKAAAHKPAAKRAPAKKRAAG
jgi:DNA end-binding protein Ku